MKIKITNNHPLDPTAQDVTDLTGKVFDVITEYEGRGVIIDAGEKYGDILIWCGEYEEVKQ